MILMGSDSDWSIMKKTAVQLKEFKIDFEVRVCSAHRTPEETVNLVKKFNGYCFIVGAGAAAHLAGVVAAHTILPVIAVPINATSLGGIDALYSIVQMPSGVPVATMAIDGAKNAAIFALQIISIADKNLKKELETLKLKMIEEVTLKNNNLQTLIKEL